MNIVPHRTCTLWLVWMQLRRIDWKNIMVASFGDDTYMCWMWKQYLSLWSALLGPAFECIIKAGVGLLLSI